MLGAEALPLQGALPLLLECWGKLGGLGLSFVELWLVGLELDSYWSQVQGPGC